MDPNTGEPGAFGEPADGTGLRPPPALPGPAALEPAPDAGPAVSAQPRDRRPPRDALTAAETTSGGAPARVAEIVAGDCLLTVNPVDGGEVAPCPPDRLPVPVRRTARQRALRMAASRPAPPPGPSAPELPLLERLEERERIVRLLSRGRSVRVTGPSGAGRSVLLDTIADACAGLAPDGVVWLSGYRRSTGDLLQALYEIVFDTQGPADGYRPGRPQLLDLLAEVGAVVVVDDLEFGGTALEELLAAAPECAFLFAATPDVPAPAADSLVEEVFLPGLTRMACLELLELVVERPLLEDETAWAADLWFESEGLPLRFVQAGALLRQRDRLGVEAIDGDRPVWDGARTATEAALTADGTEQDEDDTPAPSDTVRIPLPSLAESAAPALLLASRLSGAARETLRFAAALGGEVPNQAHLPALVGDTHGDAALGELVSCGLAVPVAAHYRLATGVRRQILDSAPEDYSDQRAHAAAQHYAWWAGHLSVAPGRVAAEAEAVLAALTACRDDGHNSTAVLLARIAAPVFAAALHWSAWERALRVGQEAARLAGEVAEEAYFHHELGVLALCAGQLDRARTELEASIALRGALADRQGTTVGRRALALVADRSSIAGPMVTPLGVEAVGGGAPSPFAPSPVAVPEPTAATAVLAKHAATVPFRAATGTPHRRPRGGSRRNLAAAGAGALLAAVLGTIVTLGATADRDARTPLNVQPVESAQPGPGVSAPSAEIPAPPAETRSPLTSASGTPTGSTASPGGTGPSPSGTGAPSSPSGVPPVPTPPSGGSPWPTPSWSLPHSPTGSGSPTGSPSPTASPSASTSPTGTPTKSTTASASATSTPVTSTAAATSPATATETAPETAAATDTGSPSGGVI